MSGARRLLVAFLGFCFVLFMLTTISAVTISQTVTPNNLKRWLHNSGIYSHVVDSVLQQSQASLATEQAGQLPLDRPELQVIARQVFSPALLQHYTEQFIDGTQDWLNGKTAKPAFQIDLSSAKGDFAKQIGAYLRQRVNALPACRLNDVPSSFDPFSITCRPIGVDTDASIKEITDQLASSKDFLSTPVINADTLTLDQNGKRQPFYQKAQYAPTVYRWAKVSPWLAGLLSVVTAGLLLWVTVPRRRGLRWLSVKLSAISAFTLFSALILTLSANKLQHQIGTLNASKDVLQYTGVSVIQQLTHSLAHTNLLLGIYLSCISAALIAALIMTRSKGKVVPRSEEAVPDPENSVPSAPDTSSSRKDKSVP